MTKLFLRTVLIWNSLFPGMTAAFSGIVHLDNFLAPYAQKIFSRACPDVCNSIIEVQNFNFNNLNILTEEIYDTAIQVGKAKLYDIYDPAIQIGNIIMTLLIR